MKVYLSGEIHSNWREEIMEGAQSLDLPVAFLTPVTTHEASDNVGIEVLGAEENNFWKDHKAAKINAIRIKHGIEQADLVIVKFGEKYRQWNAAFDAGQAVALNKSLIVIHPEEFTHALKEVDAQALAIASTNAQALEILKYVTTQV
ncbi:YtoQ family protein [Fulvivirgaceae bacterium BMA10]|uniref:YtoQ family protein n=1 Tax=Splendidivirga corallicola TaxID=3051826 RepID=A0ABT8KGQ2_9BACT|nr:YtoQ family protein [Fulvivirgaceae bacterium BMA10]